MDDQFGGRTDDDLFYDDFEPVESETIVVQEVQIPQHPPEPTPVAPAPPSAPAEPSQLRQPKPKKSSLPANTSTNEAPPTSSSQPQAKGGNLSSSRFARKGNANQKQQSTPPPPPASKSPVPSKDAKDKPKGIQQPESKETNVASPPPNAPTAPSKEKKPHGSQSTAANPQARLGSGGNPRQKLTEEELATKMERMKLLSAEKARKFEKAEKDEKQHAEAYAKGMEDARKRRAEDAERRRRGEDDKRKLEEERAKNRERKLKAMGIKEGGWDEGKAAALEEEARKGFRGANGGVRGTRRGGLSGSRFAAREAEEEHPDIDRFLDERHRGGNGRGRGGRGGGGRGRGGFEGSKPTTGIGPAPNLTADEFPALPSDVSKKTSDNPTVPVYPPPKIGPAPIPSLSTPPPRGSKWDDEMEALDELKKQGQS
ncbi:hypothetical protein EsDP_00000685 [Epichloe bromicola]|uniref:Uncharacterized protein n=1 Tax=Epichloe bromicola TaxID=79588 RepID=A0ABQ0CFM2_9HYPO